MESTKTKLQLLTENIDTTHSVKNAIAKAEAKRQDQINLIETLTLKLEESANRDRDLRDDIIALYTKLSDSNQLNYNLIINCLAKHFELPTPSTKKVLPKQDNQTLNPLSEDIVQFVSQFEEGVSMKDLSGHFSDCDKVKFATHVKDLVDDNLLSKQGEKRGTKYFPATN